MGTNFEQKCIVGFILSKKELTVIDQEEQFELQSRYDTKTGKETHKEKVMIREEESYFKFVDIVADDLYNLVNMIKSDYGFEAGTFWSDDDNYLWVGYELGDTENYGRVDLLTGSLDIEVLRELKGNLEGRFDLPIALHFITEVG
jgi:hypothetical protein